MEDLARETEFAAMVAPFRRELRAFCYRMAGSLDEADDLLQESLLRAWRGLAGFEGRASVRTWLYRVTASACIDALKKRTARKRAEEHGPPADPHGPAVAPQPGEWIGPCPPALYADELASPEARYGARESVGFAFLAALQLLPAKQRAVLVACDVLGWSAEECASLVDSNATAVASALRRARETIAERTAAWQPKQPDSDTRALLARWIDAWERVDAAALVRLLHADAAMSMPPLPIWHHGADAIAQSIDAMVFASCRAGDFRARSCEANGLPALAIYRRGDDGVFAPYALHVLAWDGDRVRSFTAFLDTTLFAAFELPPTA